MTKERLEQLKLKKEQVKASLKGKDKKKLTASEVRDLVVQIAELLNLI